MAACVVLICACAVLIYTLAVLMCTCVVLANTKHAFMCMSLMRLDVNVFVQGSCINHAKPQTPNPKPYRSCINNTGGVCATISSHHRMRASSAPRWATPRTALRCPTPQP
jgi:hypothetical protein